MTAGGLFGFHPKVYFWRSFSDLLRLPSILQCSMHLISFGFGLSTLHAQFNQVTIGRLMHTKESDIGMGAWDDASVASGGNYYVVL